MSVCLFATIRVREPVILGTHILLPGDARVRITHDSFAEALDAACQRGDLVSIESTDMSDEREPWQTDRAPWEDFAT